MIDPLAASPARFAIDAHTLGRRQTGNEVYIRELLNELQNLDDPCEFTVYTSVYNSGEGAENRVSANPVRRLGLDLQAHLRRCPADVLHVQYTAPLGVAVPTVVTVHDVSFLDCPQHMNPWRALQMRLTVKPSIAHAARILTPSDFSRRAILRRYRIDPRKVTVIPNAAAKRFRPTDRATSARRVTRSHGIANPFILAVGNLEPRKNYLGLIRAFEHAMRAHSSLSHDLVIAGQDAWHADEVRRAAARSSVGDRIRFAGFVSDADLLDFYGACEMTVMPSFYEGFGLPVLEAMACGRAVACSDAASLPEVAGHAARLFDPHSIPSMAHGMAAVLLDADLRISLERRGLHRASLFSWRRSARLTLDAYYGAAHRTPRHVYTPRQTYANRLRLSSAAS